MKNNTIDAKLLNAQVAIENSIANTTIQQPLANLGYTKAKLQEGLALLNKVKSLHTNQKKEYGEQYAATDALDVTLASANKTYMKHVKIARVAINGKRGIREALQLDGRRLHSYSGWLKQTSVFYENALANKDIVKLLAKYGVKTGDLQTAQVAVKSVGSKLAAQLTEKGQAQEATQKRDEALEDLLDWMSDFIAIARIALEEDPQLLETLGIVEPS